MNIAKQIEAKIKDFSLGATFDYNLV